jgi:hypothetical protein
VRVRTLALAKNARMGALRWLAHTQLDYARMLLVSRPGDRERARGLVEAALATYSDLGMAPYEAKAAALAQDLGHAGSPTS